MSILELLIIVALLYGVYRLFKKPRKWGENPHGIGQVFKKKRQK